MSPSPVWPEARRDADRPSPAWRTAAPDRTRRLPVWAQAGLLQEAAPGFWTSVARAVGHGIGLPDAGPSGTTLVV